jgi:hypothetical protein
MKISTLLKILIPSFFLLASCKKEIDYTKGGTTPPTTPIVTVPLNNLVRIQQGTSPNDTVYLVTYDDSKHIIKLVDSIYQDTLSADYDISGNLVAITESNGSTFIANASFTYDANNLLTQIDYSIAGSKERFTYEYINGVVTKKSYFTDAGSPGALTLYSYFTYTVSGGNITDVKQYTTGNILIGDMTMNYGTQANPFKNLSLFNYGNRLGTNDVINLDTYFNSKVLTGYSMNTLTSSSVYTFSSDLKPLTVSSTENYADDASQNQKSSWIFGYN